MKPYIGCKIIEAEPMTQHAFADQAPGTQAYATEDRDGYKVRYPDGYESWSPKDVFESAYRLVSERERELLT